MKEVSSIIVGFFWLGTLRLLAKGLLPRRYRVQATTDLQVSTDGAITWQCGLQRQKYNFFEHRSGFDTDSVAMRAVGNDGHSAVAEDVAVTEGNILQAHGKPLSILDHAEFADEDH